MPKACSRAPSKTGSFVLFWKSAIRTEIGSGPADSTETALGLRRKNQSATSRMTMDTAVPAMTGHLLVKNAPSPVISLRSFLISEMRSVTFWYRSSTSLARAFRKMGERSGFTALGFTITGGVLSLRIDDSVSIGLPFEKGYLPDVIS